MFDKKALSDPDILGVPPVPAAGLVTAHQHDGPAVGIEGEQHPHAIM
jgi:hypothetical protein